MIPKKLLDEFKLWETEGRYGHIQVNFSAGKILNYNILRSIKVEMVFTNNPDTKVTAIASGDTINLTDP